MPRDVKTIEYRGYHILPYFGGAIVLEFAYDNIFGDVEEAKAEIDEEEDWVPKSEIKQEVGNAE
jgi:hypothetical protein